MTPRARTVRWWIWLLVGASLWGVSAVALLVTDDQNLLFALVVTGSFAVPICVIPFVASRDARSGAIPWLIAAFVVTGILGTAVAATLESRLAASGPALLIAATIEEVVKAALVLGAFWRFAPRTPASGALAGMIVGGGFAAFESAGFALAAAISSAGGGVALALQVEVVRGLLSPFAHILWTAIAGAALFPAAERLQPQRLAVAILGLGLAVALHTGWDAADSALADSSSSEVTLAVLAMIALAGAGVAALGSALRLRARPAQPMGSMERSPGR